MKPPRPGTIDLDRFLPYRLSVLTNLVSSTIADTYRRRFRLGIPEWRVLAVLARFPGLSAAEVAQRTQMDAVAVSRAVAPLALGYERELLASLGGPERAALDRALDVLTSRAQALSGPPAARQPARIRATGGRGRPAR